MFLNLIKHNFSKMYLFKTKNSMVVAVISGEYFVGPTWDEKVYSLYMFDQSLKLFKRMKHERCQYLLQIIEQEWVEVPG